MKKILITLILMAGFSCLSVNAQKPLRKPTKKPQKTQTTTTPNKHVRQQKTHSQSSVSLQATGIINGHGYVDLGLPSGTKWATCNVGASSPSDYGSFFAWGETTTKSSYTEANSKTYNRKFGDISGDSNYDAARANWGGAWRLPTKTECEELIDKCKWTWISHGGHNGYKVTGPNGNSVFFPAGGHRKGTSLVTSNIRGLTFGHYWSSYPSANSDDLADALAFDKLYISFCWYNGRYTGLCIRAVAK